MSSRRYRPKLRNALRRWDHINIREPQESDWPFFWKTYKEGKWVDLGEGMELEEFKEAFVEFSRVLPDFYVAEVDTRGHGAVPVGVIISRNGGDHPNIHALWFSWAKPRQIMESASKFLCLLRDCNTMGFMQHNPKNAQYDRFFEYMTQMGLIRRVGTVKHMLGEGDDIRLYQMTRKL